MTVLMLIIGLPLLLISAVCSIIVLIDAFQNEIWKGLLYMFCSIYALYYIFAEYESEKKGLILAGIFGGAILGYGLIAVGGAMGSH